MEVESGAESPMLISVGAEKIYTEGATMFFMRLTFISWEKNKLSGDRSERRRTEGTENQRIIEQNPIEYASLSEVDKERQALKKNISAWM